MPVPPAHAREHGVAVAIAREGHDVLHVAARCALAPQPARPRSIVHLARLLAALEGFAVGVRDHEHGAARRVLRHHGDESAALGEIERVEVEHSIAVA